MIEHESTQHKIEVSGGHLSAWSVGQGPPVIFLHGGPGDTHHYMKKMAEPLLSSFQCIFFDQRGTGESHSFSRRPDQFGLSSLLEDLVRLQDHFRLVKPALVGHSWGALYGLFATIQYPETFSRAALISMGPLENEMNRAAADHLTSVLSDSEKSEWHRLREIRNNARDCGDLARVQDSDKALMRLRVKAWVFTENLREAFLEDYFQDPPPDREINKFIWDATQGWFSWDKLDAIRSKIWLCTGANDSVPVVQVRRIQESVPNARCTLIDQCGHMPWLDRPDVYYRQLVTFLNGGSDLDQ